MRERESKQILLFPLSFKPLFILPVNTEYKEFKLLFLLFSNYQTCQATKKKKKKKKKKV